MRFVQLVHLHLCFESLLDHVFSFTAHLWNWKNKWNTKNEIKTYLFCFLRLTAKLSLSLLTSFLSSPTPNADILLSPSATFLVWSFVSFLTAPSEKIDWSSVKIKTDWSEKSKHYFYSIICFIYCFQWWNFNMNFLLTLSTFHIFLVFLFNLFFLCAFFN